MDQSTKAHSLSVKKLLGNNKPDSDSDPDSDPDSESKADAVAGGVARGPDTRDHLGAVVRFLEAMDANAETSRRHERTARRLDKMCFFVYLVLCIVYFTVLVYMFTSYQCDIDHFLFWY